MLFWIEAGLSLLLVLVALRFPTIGSNAFATIERHFARVAQRPILSVTFVGVVALAARAAVLPILPVPEPHINDEFSHLLLADTLVQGRLSNPTHPMWIHFEAFHAIMRPTYASMYPPAQGILLAIGQVLANQPFVGVCLGVALMCAAICWMLQGWLPLNWALLGGLLAVARFGVFGYWADSYWGGAVAATGGALVLGALPRIRRRGFTRGALWLGLGLAVLANSRPYEGLILSLAVGAALTIWVFRQTRADRVMAMRRLILPLSIVLALAAGATTYYNWRVTGQPFRMPQQINRDTYAVAPYFIWQSPRPQPAFNHREMRDFYLGNELQFFERSRTPAGIAALVVVKLIELWCFYLGPALTLPLIIAAATQPVGIKWRNFSSGTRFLFWTGAVSIAGLAVEAFFLPHYAAPITGLTLALVVLSLRRIRTWRWHGSPAGAFLTQGVPALCVVMLLVRAGAAPLRLPLTPDWPPTWYNLASIQTERARILDDLNATSGTHLVFVRYRSPSPSGYDWVYNSADIDGARVVWARDMGVALNAELMQYFPERRPWLVEPDENRPSLLPYPPNTARAAISRLR